MGEAVRFLAPPLGRGRAVALAGWAVAARLATLVLSSWMIGPTPLRLRLADLAIFFDGHIYLLIARSFPTPYADVQRLVPGPAHPGDLAGWLPLYPLLVWIADAVVRDLRVAALAVSMASSAVATLLFYRLARSYTPAAFSISTAFAVFPPTWLLVGSLTYTEPLLLALAVGAAVCFLERRLALCGILCGLAVVTQKSGFLLLVALSILLLRSDRRLAWKSGLPLLLALVPLLLLEAWLVWLTGDPLAIVHSQRAVYGSELFTLPLRSFLVGLVQQNPVVGPGLATPQKLLTLLSLGFYAGALLGWRRRSAGKELLLVWLAVVLGFNLCLGQAWAYLNFSRFMLMAAPPALLLWQLRLSETRIGWRWGLSGVMLACTLPLAALMASVGVNVMLAQGLGPYFRLFLDRVH